jgi:hypothetical protein
MRARTNVAVVTIAIATAVALAVSACGSSTSGTASTGASPGSSSNDEGSPAASSADSGLSDTTAASSEPQPTASKEAVLLAQYQENGTTDNTDPLALKFDKGLKTLRPICRETSYKVAAETWATWKDLLKNGVNVSLLHVVNAVHTIGGGLSADVRPTDCAALLAAYAVDVESGKGSP